EDALRRLLNDPVDTAVAEAAMDALIARGDADSAATIFEAVSSDDVDLSEHPTPFLAWGPHPFRRPQVLRPTPARAAGPHGPVREGAREVLGFIGDRDDLDAE